MFKKCLQLKNEISVKYPRIRRLGYIYIVITDQDISKKVYGLQLMPSFCLVFSYIRKYGVHL